MPSRFSDSGPPARGWDAFDAMVLWAVAQQPRPTLDTVVGFLPAGISFRLIHRALLLAMDAGLLLQVTDSHVRYQLTPAGRARLVPANDRSQQVAA